MADDVRQALEEYEIGQYEVTIDDTPVGVGTLRDWVPRVAVAPRAFAALRAALDYADDLERLAYDKWMGLAPRDEPRRSHYVAVMETERQASLGIRAAILSALTDSPDMAMEDR